MFYNEKFDKDGWLWTQDTTDGEWIKASAQKTVDRLWNLLDEARLNEAPRMIPPYGRLYRTN